MARSSALTSTKGQTIRLLLTSSHEIEQNSTICPTDHLQAQFSARISVATMTLPRPSTRGTVDPSSSSTRLLEDYQSCPRSIELVRFGPICSAGLGTAHRDRCDDGCASYAKQGECLSMVQLAMHFVAASTPSMRKEDRKSPAPTSRVSFSRFLFFSAIFISLLSSLSHLSGFPSLVTVY
jgi:hypothetical protein